MSRFIFQEDDSAEATEATDDTEADAEVVYGESLLTDRE